MSRNKSVDIFKRLQRHYGEQHWWPADTPFEMMIGAILTQNTSWTNVETAIAQLRAAGKLSCDAIAASDTAELEPLIRASGYFRQKAGRLTGFARFLIDHGGIEALAGMEQQELRNLLLSVNGIGPETADSILLYALGKPLFVVDAYTKRIFSRLGEIEERSGYDAVQQYFTGSLTPSLPLYQEYHALIVKHAKEHCRVKPLCDHCPLATCCDYANHVD